MALIDKITAIADAIRNKTGSTETMTLDQMVESINTLEEEPQTYVLVDEDGNEMAAVLVDEEVLLTATANDIRLGTTAVTSDGVIEGEKVIPSYNTSEGFKGISSGSKFVLPLSNYSYTKLQAIICPFNKTISDSVSAEKVVIDNAVYPVSSTIVESNITINDAGYIDFGITNTSGKLCLIRYFTYKEIY